MRFHAFAISLVLLLLSSATQALVIDFESDTVGSHGTQFINNDGFIFADSTNFNNLFVGAAVNLSTVSPELYWAAFENNGVPSLIVQDSSSGPFDLNSFVFGSTSFVGPIPGFFIEVTVVGQTSPFGGPNVTYVTETFSVEMTGAAGEQTVQFGSEWDVIYRATVTGAPANNNGPVYAIDDINIVRGGPPQIVGMDVATTAVHPHHDGSLSSPAAINDSLVVNVFGSSIANGDTEDFFVDQIDHSYIAFGPAGGSYDPATTPITNADVDSDGDNDAQYQFLMGDTGIGCGDTLATLTGETNTGYIFEGTDSITTNCNAQCH